MVPHEGNSALYKGAASGAEPFEEKIARCNRLRDSPVFYMRRRMNGKAGKTYGQRNRFWRER